MGHYNTDELKQSALLAIKHEKLVFFNEIGGYISAGRSTLYGHDIDKDPEIIQALSENRIKTKVGLRRKWYDSDNASVQISLFKLLATDEERLKLSQSYVDVTTKGDKMPSLDVSKLSDEILEALENSFDNDNDDDNGNQ